MYYSDQLITFSGTLSDAEDDAELLTGFWESNVDGVLSDVDVISSSEGQVQGYGLLSEGQHAIELKGEDTTGKTCLASVIINVGPPNSAPLCEITEPIDGSAGPEGDSIQFVATVSDVDVPSPTASLEREDLLKQIAGALNALPARQADVLSWTFGLDSSQPLTFEEVGTRMNLSKERVRQLQQKALQTLRTKVPLASLRVYLN